MFNLESAFDQDYGHDWPTLPPVQTMSLAMLVILRGQALAARPGTHQPCRRHSGGSECSDCGRARAGRCWRWATRSSHGTRSRRGAARCPCASSARTTLRGSRASARWRRSRAPATTTPPSARRRRAPARAARAARPPARSVVGPPASACCGRAGGRAPVGAWQPHAAAVRVDTTPEHAVACCLPLFARCTSLDGGRACPPCPWPLVGV